MTERTILAVEPINPTAVLDVDGNVLYETFQEAYVLYADEWEGDLYAWFVRPQVIVDDSKVRE